MQAARVRLRLDKARDFLKGMNLPEVWEETGCRYSSALLAIHSAIAYGDALAEGLDGNYTPSPDHRTLAARLEKLLNARMHKEQNGIQHLANLLRRKSKVAYAPDAFREEEVKAMVVSANRFSTWANSTGNQLKIQGWRDDES